MTELFELSKYSIYIWSFLDLALFIMGYRVIKYAMDKKYNEAFCEQKL